MYREQATACLRPTKNTRPESMAHNQVYMPIFESFNNATSEGRDDSAEDSDGTAAATSLTAASAGGPSQRLRTSNKSALDDTDDKRKRASGKGKRKIAIGMPALHHRSIPDRV